MWKKDIKDGHFYLGAKTGWVREVLSVFVGWQGRDRVTWLDHIGSGQCDLSAFSQWAASETTKPIDWDAVKLASHEKWGFM